MKINKIELENLGYKIVGQSTIKKLTLDKIKKNFFSYLDNYEQMGFVFIDFPDQLTQIINSDKKIFYIFGKCLFGYFAQNEREEIILINTNFPYNDLIGEEIFVNTSLKVFCQIYNRFLSCIYTLKSEIFNQEELIKCANYLALNLENTICFLDENAMKDNAYWSQIVYMIDDLSIKLNFPISYFIDNKRL